MRRIQRNHQKSGGQKILIQKQLLGTKASTSKDFQRECLFCFDGVLLKDTELPGDTREAHQAGIALGSVYILCLHCQFVIQVLSFRAATASWTLLLYRYFHDNYICGKRVNLYSKALVMEANNSIVSFKKTCILQSLESKHMSFHIPLRPFCRKA